MGAWIEIYGHIKMEYKAGVAPHMGAWIEISGQLLDGRIRSGRTPHGCVD